jgi:hypothetical protein
MADFKTELLGAVAKAESDGELGRAQARRIRRAADNPRRLARMQAEAVTAIYDTNPNALKLGANGQVDWSKAFAKFLEWLPRILQLIQMFGG